MDFPAFTDSAPLTALEIEALRALHVTLQDLRHEYESALAVTHRYQRLKENAEVYAQGRGLTHHPDALHQLGRLAYRYERGVGLLVWRYASAAAVLGIRVLDRIVGDRPALTAVAVTRLCEEPSLGQLRDALSIPCSDLLIAREPEVQDRHEERRHALLRAVEDIIEFAAELEKGPRDTAALWSGWLTTFDRPDVDPLYEGVLDGLLSLAGQLPYEISWYLTQSRAGALPHQTRT
ncbi:hypothetical protein [Streptomyces botrytidirepellens]|uniref:Uncharacterized protein n=1 Tax=Streptomyces botrytidirepellens TaxID=2486417 RepID=A0A3M8X6U4_9ACTN|nr:hypothetical protein [Streptomyces botrytidirepellens]RNG37374.1 hypothetical protein EEJ42_02315 [Streptomyces botrytidirepellens]